jgi:tetratricopeptide (TPR) repeat protein
MRIFLYIFTSILTQNNSVFYNMFDLYFAYLLTCLYDDFRTLEAITLPEQLSSKIGKSVGEKLRAARTAQHYTQSQLAAPDFSVSYISAIERGQIHPSLRALEILAARLGLSSTELLPNRTQLEDRQHVSISPFEHDDEIDLQFLEIHLLINQGEMEQAITQLGRMAVRRLKRPQQLQYRYLLGTAYLHSGRLHESEAVLLEAVEIAKDANEYYYYSRVLNILGMAYAAMHNYSQAILAHQRCLNLLAEINLRDPLFEVQLYSHLGQHHMQLEHFKQALEMFQQATSLSLQFTEAQTLRTTYLDLSQRYLNEGQYTLTKIYIQKSIFLADQAIIKQLRSEFHYYLGRIMLISGKERAHSYLDATLKLQSVQNDALAWASVLIHYAEWNLVYGTLEDAIRYARQASDLTSPLGDTLIGASALITQGYIGYAQQQYDQGDRHFVDGIAMLERLGNAEEMAEQSARYAQLLEKHGKEHEAFTYFRRAFQSRQKLGR